MTNCVVKRYDYVDCPLCPHRVPLVRWVDHVAVTHPKHLGYVADWLNQAIEALGTRHA